MFSEATVISSPTLSEPDVDYLSIDEENHSSVVEPEADKPVDHVIFVIHGIGQQTEQYGQFYRHIENLQEVTRQVLQTKVPDHDVRIELIPIEWHKHIHEVVDPTLKKITLKSIPTIRLIENEYLADVLFYFSKDRGQKIIDNVTHLFNTSYEHFMENHPGFNGKIIILGYSLGGIISWDILCHQRDSLTKEEQAQYNKLDISYTKLAFKPDYLFGLGSPIGAILTFRGQDPKLYHPDPTIQFENIFHPFDPLGYRFEPLLHDSFTEKPAVLVERSIPIGPSFSFPSFPLSSSLFSFFSWKQEKPSNAIYEATTDVAKDQQESIVSGFLPSLLQYFSKGTSKANKESEPACPVDWEAQKQHVPLPEAFDKLTSVDALFLSPRPSFTRAKTCAPFPEENEAGEKPGRAPLRKSMTEQSHHWVEVLGVDGQRLTMSRPEATSSEATSSGQDLWADLNQELHKPGPAITSPGESKADVAQESSVPESEAKEEDKMTEQEAEETLQRHLPGGRRIDFVLQPESVMSMIANEYLIGLRAHFSYWTNKDFIWHMLRRVDSLDEKKSSSSSVSSSSNTSIRSNDKNK
ncbi:DDHD domain-containing protein [Sporodiniella umbellata]|nr:DDHD domain-containing protein [Sporodiniella umbellata]